MRRPEENLEKMSLKLHIVNVLGLGVTQRSWGSLEMLWGKTSSHFHLRVYVQQRKSKSPQTLTLCDQREHKLTKYRSLRDIWTVSPKIANPLMLLKMHLSLFFTYSGCIILMDTCISVYQILVLFFHWCNKRPWWKEIGGRGRKFYFGSSLEVRKLADPHLMNKRRGRWGQAGRL